MKIGMLAMRRHTIAAAILTFATGVVAQSPAANYPDRPIKIIVPFAPGGSTDILARVIGQKLTEIWGPVIKRLGLKAN